MYFSPSAWIPEIHPLTGYRTGSRIGEQRRSRRRGHRKMRLAASLNRLPRRLPAPRLSRSPSMTTMTIFARPLLHSHPFTYQPTCRLLAKHHLRKAPKPQSRRMSSHRSLRKSRNQSTPRPTHPTLSSTRISTSATLSAPNNSILAKHLATSRHLCLQRPSNKHLTT